MTTRTERERIERVIYKISWPLYWASRTREKREAFVAKLLHRELAKRDAQVRRIVEAAKPLKWFDEDGKHGSDYIDRDDLLAALRGKGTR